MRCADGVLTRPWHLLDDIRRCGPSNQSAQSGMVLKSRCSSEHHCSRMSLCLSKPSRQYRLA